jgi:HPt (histidine-containing phosphotransfer) domain-containing protein
VQAPPPPDSSLPIDYRALLNRCMGQLDFAQSLLSTFESDLPQRVEQLAQHIRRGDARAAADSAHTLKGAAGMITAESVRALAAKIEAAGRAGDLAEVASLAERLRDEARRCLRSIPEVREQINAS